MQNSKTCRDYLSSHGINPDDAIDALEKQRAYDGENSTLSQLAAGLVDPTKIDWTNQRVVRSIMGSVSGIFTSTGVLQTQAETAFYVGGVFGTTVESRSDVYFRGIGISASTILHQALHSLLGIQDGALGAQLEVEITPGGATDAISQALHDHDCGG